MKIPQELMDYYGEYKEYFIEDNSLNIIEPTVEGIHNFGTGYGHELTVVTKEDIDALLSGKMLAFSDGEYSHFLILGEDDDYDNL